MKRNKWLTLLSLALAATTLMAGCDGSTPPAGDKDSDFLKVEYQTPYVHYNYYDSKYVNEEYGKVAAQSNNLYLFRKKDKDFMNNVVDAYTLYNGDLNKVVWTYENKYEDIDVDATDEYGNKKYPEKVTEVSLNDYGVTVSTTKYVRLADEVIEENELGSSYTSTETHVFYDMNGNKLGESKISDRVECVDASYGSTYREKVLFGHDLIALVEEGEIVKTWTLSTMNEYALYDVMTDTYGYFNPTSSRPYVEVYELSTGALKFSRAVDMSMGAMVNVLDNGNLLIQTLQTSEDPNADIVIEDIGMGVNVISEIVDVNTGAATALDTKYLYQTVVNRATTNMEEAEENGMLKMSVGGALINMGYGFEIAKYKELMMGGGNSAMMDYIQIVCFDNTGKEQRVLSNSFMAKSEAAHVFKDGSYVLELDEPIADIGGETIKYAIYKEDGTFRAYLPNAALTADEKVLAGEDYIFVAGSGIYDLDMKLLSTLKALDDFTYESFGDDYLEWIPVGAIGDNILVKKQSSYDDYYHFYLIGRATAHVEGGYDYAQPVTRFAVRNVGNTGYLVECNTEDSYVIIRDSYNNRDMLYNAEMANMMTLGEAGTYNVQATEKGLLVNKSGDLYLYETNEYPENQLSGISFRPDSNNNGIPDDYENGPDKNQNGIPDELE